MNRPDLLPTGPLSWALTMVCLVLLVGSLYAGLVWDEVQHESAMVPEMGA